MFIVLCGPTHRAHNIDSALNRHRFNDKTLIDADSVLSLRCVPAG